MIALEALIDSMWVDLAAAALPAGLEPPGIVSAIAGAQPGHVGQAPVAELRDDQRLAAGAAHLGRVRARPVLPEVAAQLAPFFDISVAVREGPIRSAGEIRHPIAPVAVV